MREPLDGAALDLCGDPYCPSCARAISRVLSAEIDAEAEAEDDDARISLTSPAAEHDDGE